MSERIGLAGRSGVDELAAQLQRLLTGSGARVGLAGHDAGLPVKAVSHSVFHQRLKQEWQHGRGDQLVRKVQ